MSNFLRACNIVVGVEAGYVNDPRDPGGETKYGISKRSYPNVDIANLTLAAAQAIYLPDFWDEVQGDMLPWPLALFVFDSAVNQGQETARVLMQTALGVKADGNFGPQTLTAAANSMPWHAAHFMTVRAKRYLIAPNFAIDGDGWFNRLFVIALAGGSP